MLDVRRVQRFFLTLTNYHFIAKATVTNLLNVEIFSEESVSIYIPDVFFFSLCLGEKSDDGLPCRRFSRPCYFPYCMSSRLILLMSL